MQNVGIETRDDDGFGNSIVHNAVLNATKV